MPKPVTNAQIEDVLSSIRRLVSEESRSDIRPEPESVAGGAVRSSSAAAGALSEGGDRLVLTPSLRVDETLAPGAAVPAQSWAEEDEDFAPEIEPTVGAAGVVGESFEDDVVAEEMPPQWVDVDETAEATEEELAAALRQVADQPATVEAGEEAYVEPSFQSTRTESLTAKIAALEAAIGRTRDQWEPDGDSRDAYAGTRGNAIAWQDHVVDSGHPADAAAAESATSEDEAVLDEDALRELVAEIVRQELQGALGERITRNVRKLVRREIHRVLASQDLE
ncbi:hypothetical protein [Pseudodonghicola sp.]|uniref:hypothetical protein n=1 Tax=Pseudodonghicola sp. TaxID=1969463 RepID=UPI003A987CB4